MNSEDIKEIDQRIQGIKNFAIEDMRRQGYPEELIHKIINNNPIGDYLRKRRLEETKKAK